MNDHLHMSFNALLRKQRWQPAGNPNDVITITGHDLDISDVILVSRNFATTTISVDAALAVRNSEGYILHSLQMGAVIYGVNTGFGGSADIRTNAVEELQKGLIRGLHYGIISPGFDTTEASEHQRFLDVYETPKSMPQPWVRAAMLIRLNSLVQGASGIRLSTVETLQSLLTKNIVPIVPLRGSISASGDLSPLSYIGGAITGKHGTQVWSTHPLTSERRLTRADVALQEHSIMPVHLAAKEGLAIVNGTAVSAAVGAIVSHEMIGLAALAQVLSAMSVEALRGTDESFDRFFASVRPHPGQTESASNILAFLNESQLINRNTSAEEASLRQDRYSIRTASQWLGPLLEDIVLSVQQIRTEINSVTDNPLIDLKNQEILHGGNFQAKAVTSAMEKLRLASQSIGRLIFVQCTELINPATNNGLPPNIVVDEPNESFMWKGIDILVAALQSELGFLANPVGSHVQTAEMGNQSLNSLALISARYSLVACDILSQMAAAHLAALCQALDLRALSILAVQKIQHVFHHTFSLSLEPGLYRASSVSENTLAHAFNEQIARSFSQTTSIPSDKRFIVIASSVQSLLVQHLPPHLPIGKVQDLTSEFATQARAAYLEVKEAYILNPNAVSLLGPAAARMYKFVRHTIGIPFVREETIRTPPTEGESKTMFHDYPDIKESGAEEIGVTMGSLIGKIYGAIQDGSLYEEAVACFPEL